MASKYGTTVFMDGIGPGGSQKYIIIKSDFLRHAWNQGLLGSFLYELITNYSNPSDALAYVQIATGNVNNSNEYYEKRLSKEQYKIIEPMLDNQQSTPKYSDRPIVLYFFHLLDQYGQFRFSPQLIYNMVDTTTGDDMVKTLRLFNLNLVSEFILYPSVDVLSKMDQKNLTDLFGDYSTDQINQDLLSAMESSDDLVQFVIRTKGGIFSAYPVSQFLAKYRSNAWADSASEKGLSKDQVVTVLHQCPDNLLYNYLMEAQTTFYTEVPQNRQKGLLSKLSLSQLDKIINNSASAQEVVQTVYEAKRNRS